MPPPLDPGVASTAPQQPAAPQGVFQKIGMVLPGIANRLAAAFGNYAPLHEEQRQQQLKTAQDLANSTLETNALNRQHLQQQIENTRTPEEAAQAGLAQNRALLEQGKEFERPTDVVAPMPEGGMGHYNSKWNPATHAYETSPTMVQGAAVPNPTQAMTMPPVTGTNQVGPQQAPTPSIPPPVGGMPLLKPALTATPQTQLPALSKPTGSGMIIPDPSSPTGYSKELYDGMGNVINRIPNALPPAPFVPSSSSSSHTTPKQDVNGNWENLTETSNTSKTPTLPGIPNQARGGGGTRPASNRAALVTGADGNPLHAPLGADAKKTLRQVSTSEQMLNSIMPDLTQAVTDIGHGSNIYDATQTRASWLEYNKGLDPNNIDPNSPVSALPGADPRITKMFPAIAMMKVVLAQPFMNNSRNFQFMQQIQQHVPDPEKDTPQLMLSKAQWIQKSLPMIKRAVMESEGVTSSPNAPPPTMPGTGPKWNPKTLRYE